MIFIQQNSLEVSQWRLSILLIAKDGNTETEIVLQNRKKKN